MSINSIDSEVYILPTSYAQERIWFFEKMIPNSSTYNIPIILKVKGDICPETFKNTLHCIIERHEILRTTICEVEGNPMQRISLHSTSFTMEQKSKEDIEKEEEFDKYVKQFALKPFDLEQGPLIRFELVKMDDNFYNLLVNVHHIIFDAWSIDILKQEILSTYNMLEKGILPTPLELQYADYANWEKEMLQVEDKEKKIDFWKEYLKDAPPTTELITDHNRPTKQTFSGANIKFDIPRDLVVKSNAYIRSSASTLYSLYLAVFKVLLYKYTGQKDLIVGSPLSNRSEEVTQKLIGFFVNTLPIRSTIKPYGTFDNFLKKLIKNFFQVHENSGIPFEKIVQELNPERNANAHPFFQVMFTLNNEQQNINSCGLELEAERISTETSKFDLVLYINCNDEKGEGEIEYNSDLFSEETIHRIIRHYLVLLEEILKNPKKPIADLNILSDFEKEELITYKKSFNPSSFRFIHELFELQVKENGNHCATVDQDGERTYDQLNRRANQIGNKLLSLGIKENSIVGVQMKRSSEQISTLLGILKAGCSYVPIDPQNPDARTEFILQDTKAVLLIKDEDSGVDIQGFTTMNVRDTHMLCDENLDRHISISPNELAAYLIYTSGTTGSPKGIKISHKSLIHHIRNMMEEFPYLKDERILQNINYTFDPSITEIFGSLLSGSTLVLSDLDKQFDIEYLSNLISDQKITRAQILHTVLEKLLDTDKFVESNTLRYVFTGGEKLNKHLVEKYYQKMQAEIPLINLYGPSEATVASSHYKCKPDDEYPVAPIGKPFKDYHMVVLDENQQVVPSGVVGELYIGGVGVSLGYVNNPSLNSYSFVDLDLSKTGNTERYYRTGDMVKRLDNGDYLYISRKDSQIKVRGYRIELDEIKQVILSFPEIKTASVQVKEINGDKRLFVFLVKNKISSITANDIKDYLAAKLPYYMVPSAIVWIQELPITRNGKVDVDKLPFKSNDLLSTERAQPKTLLEFELIDIWSEILDTKAIGVEDDFFHLGGHSIKVLELIGNIKKRLDYDVPITAIFQYRTIRALSNYLNSNKEIDASRIVIPLKVSTSTEKPLFLIHPGGGGVACYLSLVKNIKKDIPIYGLQSVGYDQDVEPLTCIKQMVQRYVKEIKKVQATGPYRIAGWSMGGTIAFEIAKLLRKEHKEVSFIGLLDAHPFEQTTQSRNYEDPLIVWANSLGIEREAFIGKTETERLELILDVTKEKGILPKNAKTGEVKRIINVMACNKLASDNYVFTESIDKGLAVFHCLEKAPKSDRGIVNPQDWSKRTTKKITAVDIPGDHDNIMNSPHVEVLAKRMETVLKGC